MGDEHENWTVVHREGRHGLFGSRWPSGRERSDALIFNEASFRHESEFDDVTAQHVVPRFAWRRRSYGAAVFVSPGTGGGATSRPGLWRQSAVHHDVYTVREQVDLAALVSAVVAYQGSGDDDPMMYVSFADSHGGAMSLPVVRPFDRSTTWGPLLRDALDRAGVRTDATVRAVLGAWCEGRPFKNG